MEAGRQEHVVAAIRPGLDITQTCFRVGARHFELASLRGLHIRHSGFDPLTRDSALLSGVVLLGLLLLGRYLRPAGIVAALGIVAVLAAVSLVSARKRPRRLELWATYRGRQIPIFICADTWLFGAVDRQLRRSLAEVRRGRVQVPPKRAASAVPHPSTLHPSTMRAAF